MGNFEINDNNEFIENSKGSVIIDGMLSDEEKKELRDAYLGKKEEITDTTGGELQKFLITDVIPFLEDSGLSNEIQEDIRNQAGIEGVTREESVLVSAYSSKIGIQIPSKLEETLNQGELNLSLETAIGDIENYIAKELQLPNDSNLSSSQYKTLLGNTGILIQSKMNGLEGVVQDKIDDYPDLSLKELRWIINSEIVSYFDEIKSDILPPIHFLLRHTSKSGIDDSISQIQNNPSLSEGRKQSLIQRYKHRIQQFQRGLLSDTLNTSMFNMLMGGDELKNYINFQEKNKIDSKNINDSLNISLLSEADKQIEQNAMLCFMGAIAGHIAIEGGPAILASVIPGAGTALGAIAGSFLGAGIDFNDIFSSKETLLELLKTAGVVSKEYNMSKTLIDNILAGIGLIPGVTIAVKSAKLAKLMKKFGVSGPEIVESMKKMLPILKKGEKTLPPPQGKPKAPSEEKPGWIFPEELKVDINSVDGRKLEKIKQPFGHGSQSGSLIGVVHHKGLVPSGKLMKDSHPKSTIFQGELNHGMGKNGVNQDQVSIVDIRHEESIGSDALDVQYAKGNYDGLDTFTGIEGAEKTLKKLENIIEKDEITLNQIQIIKERISAFKSLNELEKSLLTDPFPIIYRIDLGNNPKISYSGNGGLSKDVGYKGEINLGENIKTIIVPKNKIKLVEDYLSQNDIQDVDVLPIELFEKYPDAILEDPSQVGSI